MLRTRNNTDGNKLVIFSGIALYYGDNYILLQHPFYLAILVVSVEEWPLNIAIRLYIKTMNM